MKKTKKLKRLGESLVNNPVAKFAYQFNKAQVYKDKTKYQRGAKHKGKESFPMVLSVALEKVSTFFVSPLILCGKIDFESLLVSRRPVYQSCFLPV